MSMGKSGKSDGDDNMYEGSKELESMITPKGYFNWRWGTRERRDVKILVKASGLRSDREDVPRPQVKYLPQPASMPCASFFRQAVSYSARDWKISCVFTFKATITAYRKACQRLPKVHWTFRNMYGNRRDTLYNI